MYSMHEAKRQKLFLVLSENCWDGVTVFSIVRRGGFYDTYDEQGKRIKTIPATIGNYVSICADQFIVRRGAFLDTYDAWGKKISSRAAR